MKVSIGQKVVVEGVRMTCTLIKRYFAWETYHFFYFNAGEPKDVEFTGDELDALGAVVEPKEGGQP